MNSKSINKRPGSQSPGNGGGIGASGVAADGCSPRGECIQPRSESRDYPAPRIFPTSFFIERKIRSIEPILIDTEERLYPTRGVLAALLSLFSQALFSCGACLRTTSATTMHRMNTLSSNSLKWKICIIFNKSPHSPSETAVFPSFCAAYLLARGLRGPRTPRRPNLPFRQLPKAKGSLTKADGYGD